MAQSLKDLIPQVLEKQDDWRMLLTRQWNSLVGSLKTRIRLEKIYDDTLVIGVYESHWMQELYLLSSVLQDKVNECIGEPRIAHLRFVLVEDKKREPRKPPKKRLTRPKKVTLSPSQSHALSSIKDDQLKQALTDFWGRCSAINGSDKPSGIS